MRRTFIALTLGLGLIASAGHAQTADAKVAGIVGEQGDGFLGLVTGSAPPNVQAAVAEINAGREEAYADISAKTGVPESAAGEATARQLQARIPPGQFYKPQGGDWTKK